MAGKTPLSKGHHIIPLPTLAAVFVALLGLMGLTIAASYWEAPGFLFISGNWMNNLIAIGIATFKALLVINIFMGVKYSTSLVKLWTMMGFIWFGLMFIMLLDYGTRKYETPVQWGGGAETALPRVPQDIKAPPAQPEDPNYINVRPRQ